MEAEQRRSLTSARSVWRSASQTKLGRSGWWKPHRSRRWRREQGQSVRIACVVVPPPPLGAEQHRKRSFGCSACDRVLLASPGDDALVVVEEVEFHPTSAADARLVVVKVRTQQLHVMHELMLEREGQDV